MIYLIGGSGSPNFGDELMLQHWLRYTAERREKQGDIFSVVVDNNNQKVSTQQFGSTYPHASFLSSFKRLKHPHQSKDFLENLRYGLNFFSGGTVREHPELAEACELLKHSRLIHVYGGGYINTQFSPHGALLLGLVADAKRTFGMPLIATGLGLAPLMFPEGTDTSDLKTAIALFDLLEVRDVQSYQQMRRYAGPAAPILMGHDDSLLYPAQRNAARAGHRKLHLSAIKSGNIFEKPEVLQCINENRKDFDELIYWNCAPHLEAPIISALLRELPDLRVAHVNELLFDGLPVDEDDYMLTMRFHPHMMASRLGASGQYWSGSPYYDHKHGSVNQLGSNFIKYNPAVKKYNSRLQTISLRDEGHSMLKRVLADHYYDKLN